MDELARRVVAPPRVHVERGAAVTKCDFDRFAAVAGRERLCVDVEHLAGELWALEVHHVRLGAADAARGYVQQVVRETLRADVHRAYARGPVVEGTQRDIDRLAGTEVLSAYP